MCGLQCIDASVDLLVCCVICILIELVWFFFFQAEDGIRDLVRSRGLGDVYKRQLQHRIVGVVDVQRDRAVVGIDDGLHAVADVVERLSLIHI